MLKPSQCQTLSGFDLIVCWEIMKRFALMSWPETATFRYVVLGSFVPLRCLLITFRIRHSQAKCFFGHRHVCVCLSRARFLHYCTHPDVTLGNGRECPLVVYYWADLQLVHRFRCHDNRCLMWNVSECRCTRCLVGFCFTHLKTFFWSFCTCDWCFRLQ